MTSCCSQCKRQMGFLSRKYPDVSNDGLDIMLCRQCWLPRADQIRAELGQFELSKGYTRIAVTDGPEVWPAPESCVVCSSEKHPLRQDWVFVDHRATKPVHVCRRCCRCGLTHANYFRYRRDSNNLTLDIGNPAVAAQYAACLAVQLASLRHFLCSGPSTPILVQGVPQDFHDLVAKTIKFRELKRVCPSDPGFEP